MLVRYWQPMREMEVLRRQLDTLFDDLTLTSKDQSAWTPAIELKDAGDEFILQTQLPGLNADAIEVQVAKQSVSISGDYHHEQTSDENQLLKSEFRYGRFSRIISLPVEIDNEQVKADYTNGILTLNLPKLAPVRNKVVKVNLTASKDAPTADASATDAIA